MRRDSIGVKPTLACGETVNRFELATTVFRTAPIARMRDITADVVAMVNDAFSLAKDLSKGETNNLAIVVMRANGWTVAQAIHHLEDGVAKLIREYQELEQVARRLPATMFLPEEAPSIERYLSMMRCLMRGNLDWSMETARYHEHVPDSWK